MQLARRLLDESHQGSRLLDLRVSMNLAESYRSAGMNREAAIAFKEVWGQLSALGRDETYRACVVLNNWGMALYSLGQPLEAERQVRRALAIASADESQRGVSPMLLINFARVLTTLKRLDESAAVAERAYAIAQTQGEEVVINHTLSARASIYLENGELDRAADFITELDTRYRRMLPAGHVSFASLIFLRSRLALARGEPSVALTEANRAVLMFETKERSDLLPPILLHRAEVSIALGDFVGARADAGRALGIEEQAIGPGAYSSTAGRAHVKMARSFVAQRNLDEARAAFALALEHLRPTLGAEHPETRETIRGASVGR
jgi:tetratricopeptide (TPR) repeat protein